MSGRLRTACIAFAILAAGCAGGAQQPAAPNAHLATPDAIGQETAAPGPGTRTTASGQPVRASASASKALAALTAQPGDQDYRLGPLDIVEVTVFQVPDLKTTAQINAGGLISMPLIGAVTAGGRTVRELESEIARKLGERYLQSPQVTVFVKEYTSQRITVDGAVNAPGVYQIAGRSSLLQAIALAKGLDRTADPSGVMIFRTKDGQRTAAVFDLNPIRSGRVADPEVTGGDVIVVDQSTARTVWRGIRESVGVATVFRPLMF